ncbi:MAG: glycine cleavage system protein H [Bdellovibrionia bacterium]
MLKEQLPDFFFSTKHGWTSVDENIATIGITEFAARVLGEILYIELPDEGDRTFAEVSFGTVESVAGFMEVTGLVSGVVMEVNSRILEAPYTINDDPYGQGWIMRVEMESEKDLLPLMKKDAYLDWLGPRQVQRFENLSSAQISETLGV